MAHDVQTDMRTILYQGDEILQAFDRMAQAIEGLTAELAAEREATGVPAKLRAINELIQEIT
ncbi:MAG: hypothetical protein V3S01_06930 [Dehalococcoidia bacterium]